jgi:hypothetical protein
MGNPPLYKDHPDMAIGANGTQVVETTGQSVTVYAYDGTVLSSTPMQSFISQATERWALSMIRALLMIHFFRVG